MVCYIIQPSTVNSSKTGRITLLCVKLLCVDESNMADNECCFVEQNHA